MKAQIQKWGNSLALRIPRAFADEIGLAENETVEISLTAGQLIITPARTYKLEDLLAGITDENWHDEVDWGPAVGNEVW